MRAAHSTGFLDINNAGGVMRKRVRFTRKELDFVIEMAMIAKPGAPEGDYQDWDMDGKYKTMNSLVDKATQLRAGRPQRAAKLGKVSP
jgi:hypothetical protein